MSSLSKFDVSLIPSYVGSDESHPVPFEGLWQKCGYSKKSDAVRRLKSELVEGFDFCDEIRKSTGGRRSKDYYLSADAAKVFGVRAQTPEGLALSRLFVAAYNELKARVKLLEEQVKAKAVWDRSRLEGKSTRRTFTDAVQDYIDRHRSELSENSIKWMYINASEQVNLIVFGRKAKRLADDLQIPPKVLRDGMTSAELQLVREVENTAMRMIDRLDMHPLEAVKLAGVNLLIPRQDRTVRQIEGEVA